MGRIDRETVDRILDAADIVEVVGDFVSLRRQGTSYRGLCPFHADRNPSFSVSKSRGVFKCFSCGKSGGIVSFLMELEKMTYYEALHYLAKKYGIEIQERELTSAEKQADADREAMVALNEFALSHFEHNLSDTDDGRAIGLGYFRERGINDAMVKRFHLGYAMEKSTAFYEAAIAKGFTDKYLFDTGLCFKTENGRICDRFRGRVIYPVHSVSGRVVAFGGRTLSSDKKTAKYVNSPESLIYSKSNELYGFYQAKNAIAKKKKCILVEGYMDVISMHQSGVENVVASSGTSLTDGQVRLIKRFCNDITLIYDADAAGVKASMRGINMLLAAGFNVKTLRLPEGEDPDSFAQSHTATELEEYLVSHETDFIAFMSDTLLVDAGRDPVKRASAINEILGAVSAIPDDIVRTVYIAECARRFDMKEDVLVKQVAKKIYDRIDAEGKKRLFDDAKKAVSGDEPSETPAVAEVFEPVALSRQARLEPYEKAVLRYVMKYGLLNFCTGVDTDGNEYPMNVFDYVTTELAADEYTFLTPVYRTAMGKISDLAAERWPRDRERCLSDLNADKERAVRDGEDEIRANASDLAAIEIMEQSLHERVDNDYATAFNDYSKNYIERILLSDEDDSLRSLTAELVTDKHVLSKVHTKYAHVESEEERLTELLPRAIYELRDAIIACTIAELQVEISEVPADDAAHAEELLQTLLQYHHARAELSKCLGERIVLPPLR